MVSPVKLTTSNGEEPTISQPLSTSVCLRTKHVFPRGSIQSRKISTWVNKLERINSNPGEHVSSTTHPKSMYLHTQTDDNGSVDGKLGSVKDELDDATLCFKTIQLGTEFCLMLFASSLLIIAVIVILSKKVPAFMETYEIFPKFLFILCVIVAIWSFSSWLWAKAVKSLRRYRKGGAESSRTNSNETFIHVDSITNQACGDDNSVCGRSSAKENRDLRGAQLDQERGASSRSWNHNETNLRTNIQEPVPATYIYQPLDGSSSSQRTALRWPSLSQLLSTSTKQVIDETYDISGQLASEQ